MQKEKIDLLKFQAKGELREGSVQVQLGTLEGESASLVAWGLASQGSRAGRG